MIRLWLVAIIDLHCLVFIEAAGACQRSIRALRSLQFVVRNSPALSMEMRATEPRIAKPARGRRTMGRDAPSAAKTSRGCVRVVATARWYEVLLACGWEVICVVTAVASCLIYSFGHIWGQPAAELHANYSPRSSRPFCDGLHGASPLWRLWLAVQSARGESTTRLGNVSHALFQTCSHGVLYSRCSYNSGTIAED